MAWYTWPREASVKTSLPFTSASLASLGTTFDDAVLTARFVGEPCRKLQPCSATCTQHEDEEALRHLRHLSKEELHV